MLDGDGCWVDAWVLQTAENMMLQDREGGCEQCGKKDELIKKYLELIDLLKKKTDKSLSTLRRSQDVATTSNASLLNPLKKTQAALPYVLSSIANRRTSSVFLHLRLLQSQVINRRAHSLLIVLDRIIARRTFRAVQLFIAPPSVTPLAERSLGLVGVDRSLSRNISVVEGRRGEGVRGLSRRVFELQRALAGARAGERGLREVVEENVRRQEIESKKKKESLEMLAEEMAEKNEVIAELQATLRFYEAKQGRADNNVLEEDSFANRKELERLEKANEKINLEFEKKSEQLARAEEELRANTERISQMNAEIAQLKERAADTEAQLLEVDRKRQQCNTLSAFLESKLSSLKKHEKLMAQNRRLVDRTLNDPTLPLRSRLLLDDPEPQQAPISKFQAQYKVEKILNYLYNIEQDDATISNEERLFDPEELAVLREVKAKFAEQAQRLQRVPSPVVQQQISLLPARRSKQCGDEDEVYFNEHVSGSIFEVLNPQRGRETDRREPQGLTIKLLEMELEKNKQVEKIGDLKNKLFHIRSIVMNFIKALDLRTLKGEARDIVELFFDFFEYSQEEKDVIMRVREPQRRFLGLF